MTSLADYRPERRLYAALAISPDGSQIAYCDDAVGPFNLVVVDRSGRRTELTGYADRSVREIAWHPDGSTIFFTADRDSDEFHQIFRVSVGRGTITQLTARGDVQHFLAVDAVSPDGRSLAYAANDRDRTSQDVSLLDLRSRLRTGLVCAHQHLIHHRHSTPPAQFPGPDGYLGIGSVLSGALSWCCAAFT